MIDSTPTPTLNLAEPERTAIPDDAYALVFHSNQEVEIIIPISQTGGGLTNGHILLLGILRLLKHPGWADQVIEQTTNMIMAARKEVG